MDGSRNFYPNIFTPVPRAIKLGLHVRRKHKHKKPTCKPVRRKHKRLVLALICLCLRRPRLHVRRNDANISTSTREWNDFHSLVLVLVLVSLRRTCKRGRRKHKHKRKHKTLNLLASHRFTRRFLLPAYACAYAYACVVRVNQVLNN